jgi:uncharacterized glyoxalase superfamily protein PhnB
MAAESASDVFPCLYYDDAEAAIEWLCRAFGFTKRLVVPGEAGGVVHSELSLGSAVVMPRSSRPAAGAVSPREQEAVNVVLSLYVEDPDAHCERARSAGAEILEEPAGTSFGARGYGARDPEGHHWYFASYRPGEHWES